MPRKLPKYVERNTDKYGKVRLYFRRDKNSPRIPLLSKPGTDTFEGEYSDALAGHVAAKRNMAVDAPGTLSALIVSYRGGPEFRALRETTKATYIRRLDVLKREHGARSLSGMAREKINEKILYPLADRPGRLHNTLKLLRILIRHGLNMGMLKIDPTVGIKRAKLGEIRSWTEAELGQFEAFWAEGTKQRLAYALMLYTGQRRSDVHRMIWTDIEGDGIRVIQQKTGAKLKIALHADLQSLLALEKRRHLAILTTAFGKSFTVDGFSGFMRDAIKAAGLPLDCRPHGLRKASGRRLAEAGCTPHQIMAVLGHKSLSEAERYTRGVDQGSLAESAIHLAEQHKRNKLPQIHRLEFGEIKKSKGKTT